MTETKFTPGPWYATVNGGDDPDERKLLVGKNDAYGDFTTVSDCRSKWLEDEVGGNEEANAHLIAAAPELYEALQSMVWGFKELNNNIDCGEEYDAYQNALAALAKARGEQS